MRVVFVLRSAEIFPVFLRFVLPDFSTAGDGSLLGDSSPVSFFFTDVPYPLHVSNPDAVTVYKPPP